MYNKVLVAMALDHGLSHETLPIAAALCNDGGEIIALHVHEAVLGPAAAYLDEDTVKTAFQRSQTVMKEKLAANPDVTPVIAKGHISRTIIDYATEHDIDCIVVGSHKPGLSDYFLGSTASRVVRHAPCAVHVHR